MSSVYSRVRNQKYTDAIWSQLNPVLLDGEVILVELETGIQIKVGDGVTSYTDLPFIDGEVRELFRNMLSDHISSADEGKVLGIDQYGNISLLEVSVLGGGKPLTWGDLLPDTNE